MSSGKWDLWLLVLMILCSVCGHNQSQKKGTVDSSLVISNERHTPDPVTVSIIKTSDTASGVRKLSDIGPGEVGKTSNTGLLEMGKMSDTGPGEAGKMSDTGPLEMGKTSDTGPLEMGKTSDTGPLEMGKMSDTGLLEMGKLSDTGLLEMGKTSDTGPGEAGKTSDTGPLEMGKTSDTGLLEMGKTSDTGLLEMGKMSDTGPLEMGKTSDTGPLEMGKTYDTGPKDVKKTSETGPLEVGRTYDTESKEAGTPSTETGRDVLLTNTETDIRNRTTNVAETDINNTIRNTIKTDTSNIFNTAVTTNTTDDDKTDAEKEHKSQIKTMDTTPTPAKCVLTTDRPNCTKLSWKLFEETRCVLKKEGFIRWEEPKKSCSYVLQDSWHIKPSSKHQGLVLHFTHFNFKWYESLEVYEGGKRTSDKLLLQSPDLTTAVLLLPHQEVYIWVRTLSWPFSTVDNSSSSFSLNYSTHPLLHMPAAVQFSTALSSVRAAPLTAENHMYDCSAPYTVPSYIACDMVQQCLRGEDEPAGCLYRSAKCGKDWFPYQTKCLKITDTEEANKTTENACNSDSGSELAALPEPAGRKFVGELISRTGKEEICLAVSLSSGTTTRRLSPQLTLLYRYTWQWREDGTMNHGDVPCQQTTARMFGKPTSDVFLFVSNGEVYTKPSSFHDCGNNFPQQRHLLKHGYLCMKSGNVVQNKEKETSVRLGLHSNARDRNVEVRYNLTRTQQSFKTCSDGSFVHVFQRCHTTDGKVAGSPDNFSLFDCGLGEQVHHSMVCDGIDDCLGGFDEAGCSTLTQLAVGPKFFVCASGDQVFSSTKRCDGAPDCFDQSDELLCGNCVKGRVPCGQHGCVPSDYVPFLDCDTGGSVKKDQAPVLTNVAVGKPAEQSSDLSSKYVAHKAVDGIKDTDPNRGFCAQTDYNNLPWWRVDLKGSFVVHAVIITVGDHISGNQSRCIYYRKNFAPSDTIRLDCYQPIYGRYISLVMSEEDHLTLCEVEVLAIPALGGLTNVALNKPATQSLYTGNFRGALKAVDGNRNTDPWAGFCASASGYSGHLWSWWRVDLQDFVVVHAVIITTGNGKQLSYSRIKVWESLPNPPDSFQHFGSQCQYIDRLPRSVTVRLDCSQPIAGRYVTMQSDLMHFDLCEMEVLAMPVAGALTNVARNKPAMQNSYAGRTVDGKGKESVIPAEPCFKTAKNDPRPHPWWRVDLESFFVVHGMVISNEFKCCGCPDAEIDLVFVLDVASYMIWSLKNFVLTFLSTVATDIDNGKVRVGTVTFAAEDHVLFHLNQYNTTRYMSTKINNITRHDDDKRNIADALNTVRTVMFTAANGDRPSIPNIAFVVTGEQFNISIFTATAVPEAKEVQAEGIRIYAIGSILSKELARIVSKPVHQNLLLTTQHSSSTHYNKIFAALCTGHALTSFTIHVSEDLSSPSQTSDNPSSLCRHYKGKVTWETTKHIDCSQPLVGRYVTLMLHSNKEPLGLCGMEVIASPAFGVDECDSRALDLVIVLHANSNLYTVNYDYLKRQLVWFLSKLDVSSGRVRVGFVVFSTQVHVQFTLQAMTHRTFVKVLETRHSKGQTNTAEALRVVRTQMYHARNGSRPGVSRLLVLITDENSDINANNTISEAFAAKYLDGIHIIAVGYGPNVLRQELENIASAPAGRNVFIVSWFNDVLRPLYSLAAALCPLQLKPLPIDTGVPQDIRQPGTYIYPPAVLHLDTLGMSSVKKLGGQDSCPATHFQCPRGFCIPTYLLNNGVKDCPHGQDEDITNLTCPGFYRCRQTGSCLHPDLFCDDINHCPVNDDEHYCEAENCPAVCECEGQAFRCRSDFSVSDFRFRLRYLDLSGSEKPTLTGIEEIVYLRLLNLSFCNLTEATINLAQLQTLDLSYNNVTGFKSLNLISLRELLHLDVSFNPLSNVFDQNFTDFLKRARMLKLRTLKLVNIGLEMIISRGLADLQQLSVLDIRLNPVDVHDTKIFGTSMQELHTDNSKLCCHHFHPVPLVTCYAPVNELSSCSDLLRSDLLRVLLWVLCAMAQTGNVGVLIYRAFLEQQGSSVAYKIFVINLSTADFLMGVYMAMIGGADMIYRDIYVLVEHDWQSSSVCKVAGCLAMISSEVSAFVICLITLDRFCLLRFPLNNRLHLSKFSVLLACVVVWIFGAIVATVPLSQSHWMFYSQNSICLPLPITQRQFPGQHYAFGVFIVFNFILFLIIGCGQIMIYHAVRSSSRATQKDSRKQDIAIARRLFLIVFTDFFCWFPIGVMGLLAAQGARISDVINVWAAVFVLPLNSAINPYLYTLNTLLERRAKIKDQILLKRFTNNMYIEMRACPHDKVKEMLRHCRRHKLMDTEVVSEENEDDTITDVAGLP